MNFSKLETVCGEIFRPRPTTSSKVTYISDHERIRVGLGKEITIDFSREVEGGVVSMALMRDQQTIKFKSTGRLPSVELTKSFGEVDLSADITRTVNGFTLFGEYYRGNGFVRVSRKFKPIESLNASLTVGYSDDISASVAVNHPNFAFEATVNPRNVLYFATIGVPSLFVGIRGIKKNIKPGIYASSHGFTTSCTYDKFVGRMLSLKYKSGPFTAGAISRKGLKEIGFKLDTDYVKLHAVATSDKDVAISAAVPVNENLAIGGSYTYDGDSGNRFGFTLKILE